LTLSEIIAFIIASVVLAFTPGPDNIFVLVTSLGQGFKDSVKFILGLCTGIILHTFLIVIGISTLVSQSQYGLLVLKIFAVVYLLYLSYLTYIHRHDGIDLKQNKSVANYYLRGFVMNITNPKVLMFFLAFFPQFANLNQAGYQGRLILLGVIFIAVTLVVFSFIAWLASQGAQKLLSKPRYSLIINWLAILVFVAVSVLLIVT